MGSQGYNYAACFKDYTSGMSLHDVAIKHKVPFDTLASHAAHNGWQALAIQFRNEQCVGMTLPAHTERAQELILQNRERNLKDVLRTREIMNSLLTEMELEIKNGPKIIHKTVFNRKGEPMEVEEEQKLITPKNMRDIFCALATAADLTYRALGDNPAKKDMNQQDRPAAMKINITLPSFIATPQPTAKTIEVEAVPAVPEIVHQDENGKEVNPNSD